MVEECFKSPKMNFKINFFFIHRYETPFKPLGSPSPIVLRLSGGIGKGGGVIMGGKYVAFKYISGKIKCFKKI